MRRNDRRGAQTWFLVVAVAFFAFGAGAQDEGLGDGHGESEIANASAADANVRVDETNTSADDLDAVAADADASAAEADANAAEADANAADADANASEADANAADADASADDEAHSGIETITVTVQKRSQSLQAVPAAASALSGQQIDAAGISQVQDIQAYVPSMHFGQERGEAKITLRGVSNAQGTDQSTAVHMDGIFQNRARSITALTFFDVERVEILRGPQGTLYGRNATGGAMNIISVPPSPNFEAFGDFQLGNYQQTMIRGVVNVPVVEDFAAVRLSGFWENRDGYQDNSYFSGSSRDADDADDFGIRSQLLLTPGDSLDMTFRINYAKKRGIGYALKRDGAFPPFVEFPLLGRQPIYAGATANPSDERKIYLDAEGDIDNQTVNANADIQWQVPELSFFGATNLRVLGSFTDFDDHSVNDQDYSDQPLAVASQWWKGEEWVAEIDWSSDYGEDYGWLVGLFHFGTTGDNTIDAPSRIPLVETAPPHNIITIVVPFHQDFDSSAYSVAGFGNGWYHITDKLRLEAGVRYSHDWKTSDLDSATIFLREENKPETKFVLFQGIDDSRSDNWGETTGGLSLDYQITDESLGYVRLATGYKAGTLNNDIAPIGGFLGDPDCMPPDGSATAPNCDGIFSPEDADPENIYSIEGGLKNTLLDNRLLLNVTSFIYWYDDLQVSQLFEAQNYVENAATARIWGVEVESTWLPIDALTLQTQFSFLDTTYTEYEGCIDAKDFSTQDCTGNELSRAPRFSGSFSATYEFDLDSLGSVTPFAQIYASDDVFFRPTNEAADTQDAYFLLNFRLMWRSEGSGLGLEFFVDNALDKDVATTKIVGSSLLGSPLVDAYDRPRTYGARASFAW
jgi:iron complex outermembrane receptor protein